MRTKYFNFGFLDFSGLTAELSYDLPLGKLGKLGLTANYFHLHKSNFSISGSDLTEVAGTVGASKHSANAMINWSKGSFSWFWNAIYISDAVFSNADTATTRDITGVDDWWMFHTGVAIDVNDRMRLQLNVDNVFDIAPPKYSIQAHGGGGIPGISTYYSGVLGRYFTVSARMRW
jgi:outer membrane receptor protein involved in Fe transport